MTTHMDSRNVIKLIEADGWRLKRVTDPTKSGLVTVPHPVRDIKIGTLKSIERQSGVKLR
jgi:predicted RNA binding protein YcfA (HicA-like mRNA interferase family)